MSPRSFDFAIVGAGMAGASLAAELAPYASVLLLEAESQPGYHATGRSAAFWDECYGGPHVNPLTLASGPFLREHGLLSPRGAIYIGRAADSSMLDAFMEEFRETGATIERVDQSFMRSKIAGLSAEWCDAVWAPKCADIDVAELHSHYLRAARTAGAEIVPRARLNSAEWRAGFWRLGSDQGGEWRAANLVNAAGAWADDIALMAGVGPLGIKPYRRTVAQLRTNPPTAPDLPLTIDIGGSFYFKPESGKLWLSPHDETPSAPVDAAPDELDIAKAIAAFELVVDCEIEAVEHKWAGLRSFAPDRIPVLGRDPRRDRFVWFAGQGGFGIQTAPAAARMIAQALLGHPSDTMTSSVDSEAYTPGRLL
ncbi:NAD(P)/FAD-dependent oxidoreductase [Altererythrobacter sp. MF3-039]|uniref:NAD(P)/FAD-dependent oxidoreductase n=1 Tax=Altererythrobacter sp. MF3-039 TaxID=3252901 RepID=UPI00390C7590